MFERALLFFFDAVKLLVKTETSYSLNLTCEYDLHLDYKLTVQKKSVPFAAIELGSFDLNTNFLFFLQVSQHQRDINVLKTETLRLETEIEKLEMTKSQIEEEKRQADVQTEK